MRSESVRYNYPKVRLCPVGQGPAGHRDYLYYFGLFLAVFQSADIRRNSKIFGDNFINN